VAGVGNFHPFLVFTAAKAGVYLLWKIHCENPVALKNLL
jgi:hypothetical protein